MTRPLSQKQFAALRKLAISKLAAARAAFKAGHIVEAKIALQQFKTALAMLHTDLTLSTNSALRLETKISNRK